MKEKKIVWQMLAVPDYVHREIKLKVAKASKTSKAKIQLWKYVAEKCEVL